MKDGKKIALFGTGAEFKKRIRGIPAEEIVGIYDSDLSKQGEKIFERIIESPENINNDNLDIIYICSKLCAKDMYKYLIMKGVEHKKIRFYFDIDLIKNKKRKYSKNFNGQHLPKLYIITHSLDISGASNCVFILCKVLISIGYYVIVGAKEKGNMIDAFLDLGAEVVVDSSIEGTTLDKCNWIDDGSVVIVNTVTLFYLLRSVHRFDRIIWWLHEPAFLYDDYAMLHWIQEQKIPSSVLINAVSRVAKEAFLKYSDNEKIEILPYGIEDKYKKYSYSKKERDEKIVFITVGNMYKVKNYELLIDVISMLSYEDKKKALFIHIGDSDCHYGNSIKKMAYEHNVKIEFKGVLTNEETIEELYAADIYICTSHEESLSVSITEAFMMGKPVICPDTIGNSIYITSGVNGFQYRNEDSKDLANVMHMILSEYDKTSIKMMSEESRKTYEMNFTIERFKERIEKLLS